MPDLGNPNFFTTFKGRYALATAEGVETDNSTVMLTSNNVVCLCGDFAMEGYAIGDVFATLPPECSPGKPVYVAMAANVGSVVPCVVEVSADGGMRVAYPSEGSLSVLYASSVCFSINESIYKEVTH